MNWDDIRIFTSVAQNKSFSKAAKAMGTTQATISRRIQKLEDQLGYYLFARGQDGCSLTKAGKKLTKPANEMLSWADIFETTSQDINIKSQTIIITCGPSLALLLSAHIHALKKGTINVTIEINDSSEYLDIDKGEADIAIRNKRPLTGSDTLLIKHLDAKYFSEFFVYGDKRFFANVRLETLNDLRRYDWAGYTKDLSHLPSALWLNDNISSQHIQYKLSSNILIAEVIQRHKVLAVLPRSFGQTMPHLMPVYGPILSLESEIWMVRKNNIYNNANPIIAHNLEILLKDLQNNTSG